MPALDSNWNVYSGDWGIISGELVEDYSDGADCNAGARVFYTQPVPSRSAGEMYVEIDIPADNIEEDDVYYIFPCCTTTSAIGAVTVTFTKGASTAWTVSVSNGTTDTRTVYQTGSPTYYRLHVCADHENEMVRAWISPTTSTQSAWADVDPGTGRYAALGHGCSGKLVRMDNFEMGELRYNDVVCVECFCQCAENAIKPIVTANITDATDRAECIGSVSWNMEYYFGPEVITWRGEADLDGVAVNFELKCGNGTDPETFTLTWLDENDCCGLSCSVSANAGSTCEPLSLEFGPFALSFAMNCDICDDATAPGACTGAPPIPDDCYGQYYITITEPAV